MMKRHERPALTLMELVLVMTILIALTAMAAPLIRNTAETSRTQATRASMVRVRDLIGNVYRPDMGIDPQPHPAVKAAERSQYPQLRYLFMNPLTETPVPTYDPLSSTGWRGPYLQHMGGLYVVDDTRGFTALYGLAGDPTVIDGWGNAIVLQQPDQEGLYTRLVSAGPDGVLNTDPGVPLPAKSASDDLILYLRIPDQRPE